jgi:predicted transcriptional regulator
MAKLSKLIERGIISESDLSIFVDVLVKLNKNNVIKKKPKKIIKNFNLSYKKFKHLIDIHNMKQFN